MKTLHLRQLFEEHGVPYYIKCDLEGADEVFVDQLLETRVMPKFLSVESSGIQGLSGLAKMYTLGYDRMQIVNQTLNHFTVVPEPAREGKHVTAKFSGHMSGLFGRELRPNRWRKFHEAVANFTDYLSLKARDDDLALGWTDIHFTRSETLEAPAD